MEAVTPTSMIQEQPAARRGRGRPRKSWDQQSGYVRGMRNNIIERHKKACQDNGIDHARRMEKLMEDDADLLESDQKFEESLELVRAAADMEVLRRREQRRQRLGGVVQKYTLDSPEVRQAVEGEAVRLREYLDPRSPGYQGMQIGDLYTVFEDVAKSLASLYPGVHWQSVKQALKKGVERKGSS